MLCKKTPLLISVSSISLKLIQFVSVPKLVTCIYLRNLFQAEVGDKILEREKSYIKKLFPANSYQILFFSA